MGRFPYRTAPEPVQTPVTPGYKPEDEAFFAPSQRSDGTSHDFVREHRESHLNALKAGSLGKSLSDFCKQHKIKIADSYSTLPEDTCAHYVHMMLIGGRARGMIEYSNQANAVVLGHEMRHAWQFRNIPPDILNTRSLREKMIIETFMEADARAIDFGISLQTIHALRGENMYAIRLIRAMSHPNKRLCNYSMAQLDDMCSSPQKFRQAIRAAFDDWIARSPIQAHYEDKKEALAEKPVAGLLKRAFNAVYFLGKAPCINYTGDDIRPDFMKRLADCFGNLGYDEGGNYLTQTKGVDLNSTVYTGMANFMVEQRLRELPVRPKP